MYISLSIRSHTAKIFHSQDKNLNLSSIRGRATHCDVAWTMRISVSVAAQPDILTPDRATDMLCRVTVGAAHRGCYAGLLRVCFLTS